MEEDEPYENQTNYIFNGAIDIVQIGNENNVIYQSCGDDCEIEALQTELRNLEERFEDQNDTFNEMVQTLQHKVQEIEDAQKVITEHHGARRHSGEEKLSYPCFPQIISCPSFSVKIKGLSVKDISIKISAWLELRNSWLAQWSAWWVLVSKWWNDEEHVPRDKYEMMHQSKLWIGIIDSGVTEMIEGHGQFLQYYKLVLSLPNKTIKKLKWDVGTLKKRIKSVKQDQKVMNAALSTDLSELKIFLSGFDKNFNWKNPVRPKSKFVNKSHPLFTILKKELNLTYSKVQLGRIFETYA